MSNILHRLRYLNTWLPVGDAVSEGLRGTVLGEVCHLGETLRVYSLAPPSVGFLGFMFGTEDVISQLPALATCCHVSSTIMLPPPLEPSPKIKLFYKSLLVMVFYCSNKKVTDTHIFFTVYHYDLPFQAFNAR